MQRSKPKKVITIHQKESQRRNQILVEHDHSTFFLFFFFCHAVKEIYSVSADVTVPVKKCSRGEMRNAARRRARYRDPRSKSNYSVNDSWSSSRVMPDFKALKGSCNSRLRRRMMRFSSCLGSQLGTSQDSRSGSLYGLAVSA